MRLTHNIKPVGGGGNQKMLQKNVYDTTEYLLFVVVLGGEMNCIHVTFFSSSAT